MAVQPTDLTLVIDPRLNHAVLRHHDKAIAVGTIASVQQQALDLLGVTREQVLSPPDETSDPDDHDHLIRFERDPADLTALARANEQRRRDRDALARAARRGSQHPRLQRAHQLGPDR